MENTMNGFENSRLPAFFAPLQGYTDAVYRSCHRRVFGGVEAYYTPFVRLERGEFRSKDLRDIDSGMNSVGAPVPQLIAATPSEAATILSLFEAKGYRQADLNLGCPFPMLAKRHKGSGILPYPEKVAALLEVATRFPRIALSVKLRLGWEDPQECLALLPILNQAPLSQITMHPRIGRQQYKGSTDAEAFGAFYDGCRHPLVYNGDLCTLEDLFAVVRRFPRLSGLMVGRGLLSRPWLAEEYVSGRILGQEEIRERVARFHALLFRSYEPVLQGEVQLLAKMRTLWEYLLPDIDRKQKKRILKCIRLSAYREAVSDNFRPFDSF